MSLPVKLGDTFTLDMASETLTFGGKRYKLVPDEPEKPKEYVLTDEDWQRVITEKFLCHFYYGVTNKIDFLVGVTPRSITAPYPYKTASGDSYSNCRPVRQVGIRQPHFGGEYPGHPDDRVIIKVKSGYTHPDRAWCWAWTDANLTEYIVLEAKS